MGLGSRRPMTHRGALIDWSTAADRHELPLIAVAMQRHHEDPEARVVLEAAHRVKRAGPRMARTAGAGDDLHEAVRRIRYTARRLRDEPVVQVNVTVQHALRRMRVDAV